jgi:hypothetical protein
MGYGRLLGAMGAGFLVAVVVWAQSEPSAAMPDELRTRMQNAQFGIVTSVRGLPLTVREELQKMWNSGTLDIAEPGADFRKTGVPASSEIPLRRLIAAGCTSDNYCLVYYERGGSPSTWHVALFRWTPDATRFEWGGSAPAGLKTIEDVRKASLSGVIKVRTEPW